MPQDFDPGYGNEPFRSLVRNFPDQSVYPSADFRVEWGPIFHRGRLDSSARVLMIGQDPSHNEAVVRRILVGEAGRRTQGFLAKLGISTSYVMVNTFLYSVYGQQGGTKHATDAAIAAYRNQWFDALLAGGKIEAVVALGSLADTAWSAYRKTPSGNTVNVAYAHITHPTAPDSSSKGNATKLAAAMSAMLANWNQALAALRPKIAHPDVAIPTALYGSALAASEKPDIPAIDFPPGLPEWMRNSDGWAVRAGATAAAKRANITITVPPTALSLAKRGLIAPAGNIASNEPAVFKIIDPQPGAMFALSGRVVCMDDASTMLKSGTIFVKDGTIVAVQKASEKPPVGFEQVTPIKTGGTIYPGLIELHNHLSYDALPLWNVPKKYTNRDTWANSEPQYKQLVSGPMQVIGKTPQLLPALVRFVECKCLMAGVTTSQGIALNSNGGVRKYYSGVIRTVERPDDPQLPAANTRIPDLAASDRKKFKAELEKASCMLLHLSEGTDAAARQHFLALQDGSDWAIAPSLCGIHCVALQPADFDILKSHGGSMVWSPMSNLLLYGQTADVKAAKKSGLIIGIGSDWSPSGSKNLLCELKVAQSYSRQNGDIFSDREIVAMATCNAAAILKWKQLLGSIEPGKRADLLVIDGSAADPYGGLIAATESSVRLVLIHGVAQCGVAALMDALGAVGGEDVTVAGNKFRLHLTSTDPNVPATSLAQARSDLTAALAGLGSASSAKPARLLREFAASKRPVWTLELDELDDTGVDLRPHLRFGSKPTGSMRPKLAAAAPPKLKPLKLDGLTVVDDPIFLALLANETNLPSSIAADLKRAYGN